MMLTKIRQKVKISRLARSKKAWLSLCLASILVHLLFVQSLGHFNWEIKWERWKDLRPATQKVALTVEEQEPPPPPPPRKKLQREKTKKTKKIIKKKSRPARRKKPRAPTRPVPQEVARIQSVDELMDPYEFTQEIEEEAFFPEEFEEFIPQSSAEEISENQEDKIEDPASLSNSPTAYKTSNDGAPGGFEGFQGSFSSYLGLLRHAGLDTVFVIDSTGSMGWIIDQVKTKITDLMNVIRRLVPTARIGLVSYRDRGEDYLTKIHPLTFRVGKLKKFLNNLEAEGGGDWEEAVDEGLKVAVEGIRWRRNAKKIIILVGDAPPHKDNMSKAMQAVGQFRQQGGFVSIIDASHESNDEQFSSFNNKNILQEFVKLAAHGQGECTSLGLQRKIVQQLVILTFGSRWQEVMAEYVEGL